MPSGPGRWWLHFKGSLGQPELMQPTIVAISLTYIAYTIAAHFQVLILDPTLTQFTYYCCIAGLITTIIFYIKCSFTDTIYSISLVVLVTLYIAYWIVNSPTSTHRSFDPDAMNLTVNDTSSYNSCIDKRKCSSPLHLVTQSVYMASILISLLVTLF